MIWLWCAALLLAGFVAGRITAPGAPEYPTIVEDEPHDEPQVQWGNRRMSPERYLRLFPDGPYAGIAQAELNDRATRQAAGGNLTQSPETESWH